MGYAAGSVCYADAAHAASMLCAGLVAAGDGSVTACTASHVEGTSAVLFIERSSFTSGISGGDVSIAMQPCNALTAADATEVGWALIAVAAVAACTSVLRRVIK